MAKKSKKPVTIKKAVVVAKGKSPKTGDKSSTSKQKATTMAHLLHTAGNQIGHSVVHHTAQMDKKSTPKARQLDWEHDGTHLGGAAEHIQKLVDHVMSNYPAEARELKKLDTATPKPNSSVDTVLKAASKMMSRRK